MQLNKLILDSNEKQKLVKCFIDKMSHKTICMHLTLFKMFHLSSKDALIYIDSCFSIIIETDNFLQLEVSWLKKILYRSSLLVTTEIEVYQAVTKWINHDFIEREKFAKKLLHIIRLPLLTENALKKILTEKNCFKENKDSLAVVNDILKGNFDFYRNKSSKFYTTRYCGHDSFDILYFGGMRETDQVVDNKILRIKHSDDYKNSEMVSSLERKRYDSELIYLKGNVYTFGGREDIDIIIKEVEMYSLITKTCKVVANIDDINDCDLENYAVCGFMDKIYLFGGYDYNEFELDTCIEFDTKDYSWKHKSRMMEIRENPAACIFEEKIIVSGGMQHDDNELGLIALDTVEAYDPIDDTWTEFSTMNYSRSYHKSVAVKNKLFVIGGQTHINEVYDSTSKNFAVLKPSFDLYDIRENNPFAAFNIANKLYVYFDGSSNIFYFDTTKGKWYEKPSEATENLSYFSAIRVPRF